MKVTFVEVETILNSLPIGYYVNRRVSAELSAEAECSAYYLMTDTIEIAFQQIEKSLSYCNDTMPKENAIRTNLYHEVSHAIMTPTDLPPTNVMNIFEDERIEFLLNNYYLDTDFNKFKYFMNGFKNNSDIPYPQSAIEAFYSLVRFKEGHGVADKYIPDVYDIIHRYSFLEKNTSYNNYYSLYDYRREVNDLYCKVAQAFNLPIDSKDINGNYGKGNSSEKTMNGNTSNSEVSYEDVEGDTDELIEQAKNKNFSTQKVNSAIGSLDTYIDDNLTKTLEMIIANFNKKNSGGSGTTGYSGVFNPRNVATKDYRYFDRKLASNGNNQYGTCHLNLFIDNSGSFCNNAHETNTILKSLYDICSRNQNFTVDVVHCGSGTEIMDKKHWAITADDGTALYEEIVGQFASLQKKNTYNYNIVLYDGGCCNSEKYFKVFDTNNTTMILESSNRYDADKLNTCKVIYEDSDYCGKLKENIIKILSQAFR